MKVTNRAAVTSVDYAANLSVIVPYPAPCSVAIPAVPAVRYCKRLSGFLGFFQRKIPLMECFPLGGQHGILYFPCLCRDCGLVVHHAFEIVFRRCKQDLLGFGQRLLSLVLEINAGLFYVLFQSA